MKQDYQLGLTKDFECNYLPGQKERLLVAVDPSLQNSEGYDWLMSQGFRRSGDQIYRPHCKNCQACESVRVMINEYSPSKSQKRLLKKNQRFVIKTSTQPQESYYPLYERYINTLHKDGSMYPATFEQYKSFLTCNITEQLFIEVWDQDILINVAVTDVLSDGLSAVYTFYNPDYRKASIGIYSILMQLDIAKKMQKAFLYLGYQIDDCQKMNYKNKYYPYQRLSNNTWYILNK